MCSSLPSYAHSVCSYGNCTQDNVCVCVQGSICDMGIANLCDIAGNCRLDHNASCIGRNECQCNVPLNYGNEGCSEMKCFGLGSQTHISSVCSAHGTCTSPNNCQCEDGYGGLDCSFYSHCLLSTTSNATECLSINGTEAVSESSNFNVTMCHGYYSTDVANVCSGHGTCLQNGNCVCEMEYGGAQCQYPVCYALDSTHPMVCSNGRGICQSPDNCVCGDIYTTGPECNTLLNSPCEETVSMGELESGMLSVNSTAEYAESLFGSKIIDPVISTGKYYLNCDNLLPFINRDYTGYITSGGSGATCIRNFTFDSRSLITRPLVRYNDISAFGGQLTNMCPSIANSSYSDYDGVALRDSFVNPFDCYVDPQNYTERDVMSSVTRFRTIQEAIDYCGVFELRSVVVRIPEDYNVTVRYKKLYSAVDTEPANNLYTLAYNTTDYFTETIRLRLMVSHVFMVKVRRLLPGVSLSDQYRSIRLAPVEHNGNAVSTSRIVSHFSRYNISHAINNSQQVAIRFTRPNTLLTTHGSPRLALVVGQDYIIDNSNITVSYVAWKRLVINDTIPLFTVLSSQFVEFERCVFSQFEVSANIADTTQSSLLKFELCGADMKHRDLVSQMMASRQHTHAIRDCVFDGSVRSRMIDFTYRPTMGACPDVDYNMLVTPNRFKYSIVIRGNKFYSSSRSAIQISEPLTNLVSPVPCKCIPMDSILIVDNSITSAKRTTGITGTYGSGQIGIIFETRNTQDLYVHPLLSPSSPTQERYAIRSVQVRDNVIKNLESNGIRVHARVHELLDISGNRLQMNSSQVHIDTSLPVKESAEFDSSMIAVRLMDPSTNAPQISKPSIRVKWNDISVLIGCPIGSNCGSAIISISGIQYSQWYFTIDIDQNYYNHETANQQQDDRKLTQSGFRYGLMLGTTSLSEIESVLLATYGTQQYHRTSSIVNYQREAWNYRLRNYLMVGNLYDVIIYSISNPITPATVPGQIACAHVCKGQCDVCQVDPSRFSASTSGVCYLGTMFDNLAEAMTQCFQRHQIAEIFPSNYTSQPITLIGNSVVPDHRVSIRKMRVPMGFQTLTTGTLMNLQVQSRPILSSGYPMTITSPHSEPSPHPFYLKARNILFSDIEFRMIQLSSTTNVPEYALNLFGVDSQYADYYLVQSLRFRSCKFYGHGLLYNIFSASSLHDKISLIAYEDCLINNWNRAIVPPVTNVTIMHDNTITNMQDGVLSSNSRHSLSIRRNVASSSYANSVTGAMVTLSAPNCIASNFVPLGCIVDNNDISSGLIDMSLASLDLDPTESEYGTMSIYKIDNLAFTNVSTQFYGNRKDGYAYGILYSNMPHLTCSAANTRSMKIVNQDIAGAVYDICCDKGVAATQYCCRGACVEPRPPPLYCVVDPSYPVSGADYLWNQFHTLKSALQYCHSNPKMIIYVKSGLVETVVGDGVYGLRFRPSSNSANNQTQRSLDIRLDTGLYYDGVTPTSLPRYSPVINTAFSQIPTITSQLPHLLSSSQFDSVSIQNMRFIVTSPTASSVFVGDVRELHMYSNVLTSSNNNPLHTLNIIHYWGFGACNIESNVIVGSIRSGIYITQILPSPVTSTMTDSTIAISKNRNAASHSSSFIFVRGAAQVVISDNECVDECGTLRPAYYQGLIYVDMSSLGSNSFPSNRTSLIVERNVLEADDSIVYDASQGQYFAGLLFASLPNTIHYLSSKSNSISGYEIGALFLDTDINTIMKNEPPGHTPLLTDSRRPLREFAVLNDNLIQGTIYDIKRNIPSTSSSIPPNDMNHCNDLCLPDGGAECQVSREYRFNVTESFGYTKFNTIQEALAGCPHNPLRIKLMRLSLQNRTRIEYVDEIDGITKIKRITVHWEDVALIGNQTRDTYLVGELSFDDKNMVILAGSHTILTHHSQVNSANSTSYRPLLSISDIQLHPAANHTTLISAIFPNPATTTQGFINYRNISVSNMRVGLQFNGWDRIVGASFLDMRGIHQTTNVQISGVIIGRGMENSTSTQIRVEYREDGITTNCTSRFTMKNSIVASAGESALRVVASTTTNIQNNRFYNCGFVNSTLHMACVYVSNCKSAHSSLDTHKILHNRIQGPNSTLLWNSGHPKLIPLPSPPTTTTVYYTGLWCDLRVPDHLYTSGTMTTQEAYNYAMTRWTITDTLCAKNTPLGVGIRMNIENRAVSFSASSDDRYWVRELSSGNLGIGSRWYEDVMVQTMDQSTLSNRVSTRHYYCTQGCPEIDNIYIIKLSAYCIMALLILFVCWCRCCNGISLLTSHDSTAHTASNKHTKSINKKKAVNRLDNYVNKQQQDTMESIHRTSSSILTSSGISDKVQVIRPIDDHNSSILPTFNKRRGVRIDNSQQ